MNYFKDLVESLKVEKGGFSGRKLSAALAVMISAWITTKNANATNVVELCWVWLGFAVLCLSIVTIDQLVTLRTGTKITTTKEEQKETITASSTSA